MRNSTNKPLSCSQHWNRFDLFYGQHVPVDSFGPLQLRFSFDDLVRRDNRRERNIVLGHRNLFIHDLEREKLAGLVPNHLTFVLELSHDSSLIPTTAIAVLRRLTYHYWTSVEGLHWPFILAGMHGDR